MGTGKGSNPICHNCTKKFTKTAPNLPILISCGHTFCETCLAKFCRQIKWSGNINCPECREETYIEDQKSLKQLPVSTHIYGLISAPVRGTEHAVDRSCDEEELSAERDVLVKEEEESEDEDEFPSCIECKAVAHTDCHQCGFAYCQRCFDSAHRLVALRNHTSKPVQPKTLFERCTEHHEAVPTHYLLTTGAPVCPQCQPADACTAPLVETPEQVQELMDRYNVGLEQLTETEQLLNELVPTMEDDFGRLSSQIKREFANMHGMLQAREKVLLLQLESKQSECVRPILGLSKSTRQSKRQLSQSFNWLHKNKARSRYLLKKQKKLEAISAEISAAKTSLNILSEKRPVYQAQSAVLTTYIKEFSYINTEDVHQYELAVPSEGLNMMRLHDDSLVQLEDDCTWGEEEVEGQPLQHSVADAKELVVVSTVYNPHHFYVQKVQDRDTIDKQQLQLVKYYGLSATSEDYLTKVQKGQLVCAKYSADDLWYRARVITATSKDNIKVVYVDYGNEEVVTLNQLRKLRASFTTTPAFAIKCCFHGIAPRDGQNWTHEAIESVKRTTQDQEWVLVTKSAGEGLYEVDLHSKNGIDSVKELLVLMKHACFSSSSLLVKQLELKEIETLTWPSSDDDFVGVSVSYIVHPNNFYIHLAHELSTVKDIAKEIEVYTEHTAPQPLRTLAIGSVCLAWFVDELWYRGVIVEVANQDVWVLYCDYGNTELIPRDWVCEITEDLCTLPRQAYSVSLEGVSPDNNLWSVPLIQHFTSIVTPENTESYLMYANMLSEENGVYKISLTDTGGAEDVDVAHELIKFGGTLLDTSSPMAPQTPLPSTLGPQGTMTEVHVSEVTSPSAFHVNLASRRYPDYLRQFTDHYNKLVSNNSPATADPVAGKVGEYVAADLKVCWIRAKILEVDIQHGTVKVVNIDQGKVQEVSVTSLKPLIPEFRADPVHAVRCYMDGVVPVEGTEWSPEATKAFYKCMSRTQKKNLTCFATVMGPQCKADNSWPVEYIITDPSTNLNRKVTELLITSGHARAVKQIVETVKGGYVPLTVPSNTVPVTVTHTTKSLSIFVQLVSDQARLEELQCLLEEEMESYVRKEGEVLWEVGSSCVVKYPENELGKWTRGAASRIMGDYLMEINMVDTGIMHTFKKSDAYPVLVAPHIPTLALPCMLANIEPPFGSQGWSKNTVDLVYEKTVRERCKIEIVGESDVWSVKVKLLLRDGTLLSDLLVEKGLAVNSRPPVNLLTDNDIDMISLGSESLSTCFSHFEIMKE